MNCSLVGGGLGLFHAGHMLLDCPLLFDWVDWAPWNMGRCCRVATWDCIIASWLSRPDKSKGGVICWLVLPPDHEDEKLSMAAWLGRISESAWFIGTTLGLIPVEWVALLWAVVGIWAVAEIIDVARVQCTIASWLLVTAVVTAEGLEQWLALD